MLSSLLRTPVCNRFIGNVCVQGDWRGKVNIMGGDNIGHTGEEVHIYKCLILNGYRVTAVWIYKRKSTVDGNKGIVYC